MAIKPLSNYILIREQEKAETTRASGLVLPDSVQQGGGTARMEVVAVGPGAPFEGHDGILMHPVSVAVGDIVLVNKHAGTPVEEGDDKYRLIRDGDLLATIE